MQSPTSQSSEQLGEFELITQLTSVLGVGVDPDVLVGVGDDCAVIRRRAGVGLYTTDTMVDGVHFRAGQIPWFDLGWKVIAVNLSDIAAMGGTPLSSLMTLGIPASFPSQYLTEVYRGVRAATDQFGGAVVGGDVVRSPVLFLSVAMWGDAPRVDGSADASGAILRRNARPGDAVAVTGTLGSSAGGLRTLVLELDGKDVGPLRAAHFRPTPRLDEGRLLAKRGICAGMDVSDGLVADLEKLCAASRVCAEIEVERIPVDLSLKRVLPNEWLQLALGGGEDYELLFTGPEEQVCEVAAETATPVTVIGEITECTSGARPSVRVRDASGRLVEPPVHGWDHLRPS